MTLTRGALSVVAAAAVVLSGFGAVPTGAVTTGASERVAVNRVSDTVLRGERYLYQRESWRVTDADGLPGWVHQRRGRIVGTAPRLGRWRIVLEERGVGRNRGERRRTVLVLRSVTERAAPGTVLVSRGLDGRAANGASYFPTTSGDGSTVVFSSTATNLVPGTTTRAGRLYVYDVATQQVSLLHPEQWATVDGLSRDGTRVLVRLSAGLFLIDRTDGSVTQVARLLEWTRATGATRVVVPDVGDRRLIGLSGDGRLAAFVGSDASDLLDTTSGTFRSIGRTGLEGGHALRVEVSDNGSLVAVRGTGLPAGHGHGGDPVGVVLGTLQTGSTYGPAAGNLGGSITASGSHFTVATATSHLRIVTTDTSERTSPFLAPPSGEEYWASLSDDASRLAYVSDGHDVLHGTRRGVANVFLWVRTR